MRKLLLALSLLMMPMLAMAQVTVSGGPTPGLAQPDCNLPFSLTTATPSANFDNRTIGCTTWHLMYYVEGFTVVSIQPEKASSVAGAPGAFTVWPSAQVFGAVPLTTTTQGQVTFSQFFPWVRVNPTTLTGAGTIAGRLLGWKPQGSPESTASAGPAQGAVAAGKSLAGINPEIFGGISSGNANFMPLPDSSPTINPATATTTLLVAAPGAGKTVYVSAIELASTGTQTVKFVDGTQATTPCDTTQQTLSPTYQLVASQNYYAGSGFGTLFQATGANRQICAVTSAAVSVFITAHETAF